MTSNATPENPHKGPRQAAIVFIFVTVVLDVLSLGVTIPVAPKLIEGMVFREDYASVEQKREHSADYYAGVIKQVRKEEAGEENANSSLDVGEETRELAERSLDGITAQASNYWGVFNSVWALMQFVFAPFLGTLSDRFGRRKVILLSCLGLGLDYILMALAPSLVWLFIGRVLSGITAASFATAGAYIADVTPPEKRAASYGMFGAAWGFGFVIGPAVGGLLGVYGLRIPFLVAAVLTLINAAYGFFILPESLAKENRSKKFRWSKANPLGSLKLLRSHPELLGLAGILLTYQIAHQVFPSVFVLYAGHRYGWDEAQVGFTLMVVGLVGVVMQGFVVRRMAPILGERRMLFIALFFGAAGYLIYALALTGWQFWAAIPVFALVGFFTPAMQGLMTRRVAASEQGQLQGANSSMMGIAGMIGPMVFTWIFSVAIADPSAFYVPGAPFLLATGLHVLAIVLAIFVLRGHTGKAGGEDETDESQQEAEESA